MVEGKEKVVHLNNCKVIKSPGPTMYQAPAETEVNEPALDADDAPQPVAPEEELPVPPELNDTIDDQHLDDLDIPIALRKPIRHKPPYNRYGSDFAV